MATQRTDGTWTPIEEQEPALKRFMTELDLGTARAFHVGTVAELQAEMGKAGLQEQIDEIRADLAERMDKRILSEILEIPSKETVAAILKGGPDGDQG